MVQRAKRAVKSEFDWGGFKLLGGMGVAMTAFGVFLFWACYTVPEGAKASVSQSHIIMRMIPQETHQKIALGASVLFILFGLFLLFTTVYRTIKFAVTKRN